MLPYTTLCSLRPSPPLSLRRRSCGRTSERKLRARFGSRRADSDELLRTMRESLVRSIGPPLSHKDNADAAADSHPHCRARFYDCPLSSRPISERASGGCDDSFDFKSRRESVVNTAESCRPKRSSFLLTFLFRRARAGTCWRILCCRRCCLVRS